MGSRAITTKSFLCLNKFKHARLRYTQATSHVYERICNTNLDKIRNIGIMAHIDAGKTTTTEKMLYLSGVINTVGRVDDGTTLMDYLDEERERGITISSASASFPWKNCRVNLIDTPGHVDFTIEVERSLRILDGAITVLDASAGVEAQTLTVWNQANRYQIPKIFYLNKFDKPNANIDLCLKSIKKRLHTNPLLCHLPVGEGKHLHGLVDLINLKLLIWNMQTTKYGESFQELPVKSEVNEDFLDEIIFRRQELINQLGDLDEKMAELIINGNDVSDISPKDIVESIKRVTHSLEGAPVFLGSSFRGVGVQPLLDAVIQYLPSPIEIKRPFEKYYKNSLCGFAFKTIYSKQKGGLLTFVRLFKGNLSQNSSVFNINHEITEKVNLLYMPKANDLEPVETVSEGNIAVVSGLKYTKTGDTLVNNKSTGKTILSLIESKTELPIRDVLPGMPVPEPVFFCNIEAPSLSYQRRLEEALTIIQLEDPSFTVRHDEESGQLIIAGMGELHIQIILQRIRKEFKVDADIGPLQVSYHEYISNEYKDILAYERLVGSSKQHAEITLSLRPSESDGNVILLSKVKEEREALSLILPKHISALKTGITTGLRSGPLLGFPVDRCVVTVHNITCGKWVHDDVVSAAAGQLVQNLLKEIGSGLMEPVMKLNVIVEQMYSGSVLGQLSKRRSEVVNLEQRGDYKIIECFTPLAELMDFSTVLRSCSSGTGSFTMEYDSHRILSSSEQDKIMQKMSGYL